MRDYSINIEEQENFILNYEVQSDNIIVHLATGENYIVPYTLHEEMKLLEKMKKQVLNCYEFEQKEKKELSKTSRWIIHDSSMITLNSISLSYNYCFKYTHIILISWFVFDIANRISTLILSNRNINDINKNKLFLEYEELLNERVISDKKISYDFCNAIEVPAININTIDKIRYKKLKSIIEKIKKDENFKFDYASLDEKKSKVLTKKFQS